MSLEKIEARETSGMDRFPQTGLLQGVSAHEFKVSQADTYAAADRAPVAIVKALGRRPGQRTHVLLSVLDYEALRRAATTTQGRAA